MKKASSKKSTGREILTCLAISYIITKGNRSTIKEFNSLFSEYYYNDNIEIRQYMIGLPHEFSLERSKSVISNKYAIAPAT
jgi:hypothetical protein